MKSGFSLIEILLALTLVTIMLAVGNFGMNTERDLLKETTLALNRSIRYASSEAILRGRILRLKFDLNKNPQEYTLEEGPAGNFYIPSMGKFGDENNLSILEKEKFEAEKKKVDKEFEPIAEFKDTSLPLDTKVRLIAVASGLKKSLTVQGEGTIYFFPSGEKDSGLIILGTEKEISVIKIAPFKDEIDYEIKPLNHKQTDSSNEDILDTQDKMAEEIFRFWSHE